MSLLAPDTSALRPTVISCANPAAKLAAAAAVTVVLLLSVDVVTAGTAVLLELLVLPWCGVALAALARRLAVVALAAVLASVSTAFFAVHSGTSLFSLGPLELSTGSLTAAAAIGLRIVAVGTPGVVLLASTDPTELGDSLAQVVHLPHRFVMGGLAALRLVDVLVDEWRQLGLARRARGLGDDSVLGRLRTGGEQAFSLLVLSVRRAAVLATAMEARGFGGSRRTWARPSALRPSDAVVVGGGVLIAAAATTAGVMAGTWRLLLT